MSLIARLVERLKGRFEMPEQRAAARAADPWLIVEIGGYDHSARDWSAGGVCVEGFAGEIAVGDRVGGRLRWHKREAGHDFTAEVVRIEPGGIVALRWLDLAEAALDEMEAWQS
ncbi:MAG TPA: PilZ domain-containing protein [Parvibaculum sp.]